MEKTLLDADARGNPRAVWKLVLGMKLCGLPKEALNTGFFASFEVAQFEQFWTLPFEELYEGYRQEGSSRNG